MKSKELLRSPVRDSFRCNRFPRQGHFHQLFSSEENLIAENQLGNHLCLNPLTRGGGSIAIKTTSQHGIISWVTIDQDLKAKFHRKTQTSDDHNGKIQTREYENRSWSPEHFFSGLSQLYKQYRIAYYLRSRSRDYFPISLKSGTYKHSFLLQLGQVRWPN